MVCNHKYKIIRAEEGKESSTLLSAVLHGNPYKDIIIYHIMCEKCGMIRTLYAPVCNRNVPYKLLKETKWQK